LDGDIEPFDPTDIKGQKIKKKGPVILGFKADHFSFDLIPVFFVDIFKVGGFPTSSRAVIYDFDLYFPGFDIDKRQIHFLLNENFKIMIRICFPVA
jgi:hypothetical protein